MNVGLSDFQNSPCPKYESKRTAWCVLKAQRGKLITDSLRFLVATANMRTSPLCLHVGFCDDPEIASLEPWFLCHQASPDTSQPFTGACVRLCRCYRLHHVLSPSVSEHHPTSFHPQMGASALMTQSQSVEKGKVACQGLQQTAQQML